MTSDRYDYLNFFRISADPMDNLVRDFLMPKARPHFFQQNCSIRQAMWRTDLSTEVIWILFIIALAFPLTTPRSTFAFAFQTTKMCCLMGQNALTFFKERERVCCEH